MPVICGKSEWLLSHTVLNRFFFFFFFLQLVRSMVSWRNALRSLASVRHGYPRPRRLRATGESKESRANSYPFLAYKRKR
ncbi:hypothetical protein QBC38DRAFT_480544 [Podospora fimiseda]|uniref:Uncharacterized protein n=1 Tax=Podospora fimiseda TaxID=252190 RepID=A0AAN7BN01_9PEZI|nr:hypothetical protein QBC38DRAFT_480544 [Podospora fimiseda]